MNSARDPEPNRPNLEFKIQNIQNFFLQNLIFRIYMVWRRTEHFNWIWRRIVMFLFGYVVRVENYDEKGWWLQNF